MAKLSFDPSSLLAWKFRHPYYANLSPLGSPLSWAGSEVHIILECVAFGYASKATDSPKILGELCYGVGCQLMQLHLKLEQDIS
jgi:hypothetical protein